MSVRRILTQLSVLMVLVGGTSFASPSKFRTVTTPVDGTYNVKLLDSTPPAAVTDIAQTLISRYGGRVRAHYIMGVKGFTVTRMTLANAQLMASSEESVDWVEQTAVLVRHDTQALFGSAVNQGLDRVDQRQTLADSRFRHPLSGAPANANDGCPVRSRPDERIEFWSFARPLCSWRFRSCGNTYRSQRQHDWHLFVCGAYQWGGSAVS